MHIESVIYSISFLGLYFSAYLWGVLGIKSICDAYSVLPFWPLFIFTLAMAVIHVIRFSKKNSVLHAAVPALYGLSLFFMLPENRIEHVTLPLCIALALIFAVLNIEVLKYFKKRQKKKAMVPIRFKQNGYEIIEDLRFLDRRLSWDYFKMIEMRK